MSKINIGSFNAPGATIAIGDHAMAIGGEARVNHAITHGGVQYAPETLAEMRMLVRDLIGQLNNSQSVREIELIATLGHLQADLDQANDRIDAIKIDRVKGLLSGLGSAVGAAFGVSSRLLALLG